MAETNATQMIRDAVRGCVIKVAATGMVVTSAAIIILMQILSCSSEEIAAGLSLLAVMCVGASVHDYFRLCRVFKPVAELLDLHEAGKSALPQVGDAATYITRTTGVSYIGVSALIWLLGSAVGLVLVKAFAGFRAFTIGLYLGAIGWSFFTFHGMGFMIYKRSFQTIFSRLTAILDDSRAVQVAPFTLRGKTILSVIVGIGICGSVLFPFVGYQARLEQGRIALLAAASDIDAETRRLDGEPVPDLFRAGLDKLGGVILLSPRGEPEPKAPWEALPAKLQTVILATLVSGNILDPAFDEAVAVRPLKDGRRAVFIADRGRFGGAFDQIRPVQVLIISLAMLAFVIVSWLFVTDIAAPVQNLRVLAGRLAEGKLGGLQNSYSDDDMGALDILFTRAARNLGEAIRSSQELARNVATSSEELAATAETFVGWSNEVSKESKQAGDLLTGIAAGSSEVKDITRQAETGFTGAATEARGGQQDLDSSAAGLHALGMTLSDVFARIEDLTRRSDKIVSIVDTIREITAQTNMLSLNAAIEAARAGEHGRGFSVVADEIRKLADLAARSADEINQIVKQVNDSTKDAAARVEAAKTDFLERETAVQKTAGRFQQINATFGETGKTFESLSQFAGRQSELSETANQALKKIGLTQSEQSAAAEELRATAGELNRLAEGLSRKLSEFDLG